MFDILLFPGCLWKEKKKVGVFPFLFDFLLSGEVEEGISSAFVVSSGIIN